LQCLANLSSFGNKEPWMEPMNAFINAHRQEFKDYIDQICGIPTDQTVSRIPPSYATPITIFSRLPATSKEGFPSLPYLIDQAREFATLTNTWIEATASNKPTENDGDEIVTFDRLCYTLRERTRETINRAMRAERPSGAMEANWEEMIESMDRQLRVTTQHSQPQPEPEPVHSKSSKSTPMTSPNALSGPVSALSRAARRFKGAQVIDAAGNSTISLPSQRDNSAVPSPVHSHHEVHGRTSPWGPSPATSAAASAAGWEPGNRNSVEHFPTHALAWDDSSGRHHVETEDNASLPISQDEHSTRRFEKATPLEPSLRSLDVEDGSIRDEVGITESERSPASPREASRRLVDVWGFRRKDKDKDKEKDKDREKNHQPGPSESGRSDNENAKRGTLTKKDRERERKDREKEGKGKGKK
jgi:hypothetical protein